MIYKLRRHILSKGSLCLAFLAVVCNQAKAEDATFVYAVQISAVVQTSPPQIKLSWPPDPYGANNYVLYRKAKEESDWGSPTPLSGSTTSFVDSAVAIGSAYEYKITKAAS